MKIAYLTCIAVAMLTAAEADLSVSINGAAPEVRTGSPLLISATRANTADASWTDAIAPTIAGEDGSPVTLTPLLRSATASDGFSRALWTVSPDEVRNLPAGQYTLQMGEARATFRVTLQEASTDPERERDLVLQSRFKALDGHAEEAMTDIDTWLASHPASVAALLLKADLHESAGQPHEALHSINRALAATGAAEHAPIPLLRRQAHLEVLVVGR